LRRHYVIQRRSNRNLVRTDAMVEQFGISLEVLVERSVMRSIHATISVGTRINILL
jgi:hypothetical protein